MTTLTPTPTTPNMASEQTPLLQNQCTDPPPEVYDGIKEDPVGEGQPPSRSRFTKGEFIRYFLFALFAVALTATIMDAIIRTPDTKVFPNVPREYSDH
jgi:hypothetical protein